jgi:DNA primase catalytic core
MAGVKTMTKDYFKGKRILKSPGHFIDEASNTIEEIKRAHNIVSLFTRYGVELKPAGASGQYMGLCCFHDDHNPSLSVNEVEGKFHCFGCNASGSVIDLVMKKEGLSIKEALKKLSGEPVFFERQRVKEFNLIPSDEEKSFKTDFNLNLITEYYQKRLSENPQALIYLEKRGLKTTELLNRLKIGFSDGSLLNIIGESQKNELKKCGIVRENDTEHFENCVIFPVFDESDNTVGFYGRNISDATKAKHLYLKGKHKGVFNRRASTVYNSIILTESIIDAVSLMEMGFQNVQACYGVNGFTDEHLSILKSDLVKEVAIGFDNDNAGIKASEELKEKLVGEGFKVKILVPPSRKDWNEELVSGIVGVALKEGLEKAEIFKKETLPEEKGKVLEKKKQEIILQIENRIYQLTRFNLKVLNDFSLTLKVRIDRKFYLTEVNLSKGSAREGFTKEAKEVLSVSEEVFKADLFIIMEKLEEFQREYLDRKEQESFEVRTYEITADEEWETRKLLGSYDVLTADLTGDIDRMGYAGEDINKYAWYLAVTSRKLAEPLNILSLGQSGGGKSFGQESILKFVPDEQLKKYSKITPKALFYYGRYGLCNNVVAIDEIEGIEDAMYSLRTFLSSGYLTSSAPRIDPKTGQLNTFERRVEGPISCFLSCTNLDLVDFETKSRFLITGNDETREQTEKILKLQYEMTTKNESGFFKEREAIIRKYKNIQKVLSDIEVRMPVSWIEKIRIRGERLGERRLNKKYISIIKSITIHRQYLYETLEEVLSDGKVRKYLMMTPADVELANRICRVLFTNTTNDLLPPVRTLLLSLRALCEKKCKDTGLKTEEVTFTKSEAMECSRMSEWQVRHYMRDLMSLEYVVAVRGKFGQRYVFKLLNPGRIISESDFEFIDPNIL